MLQQNQVASVPVCGRCRKIIEDVCYVEVCVSMILQKNFGTAVPQIFYNKESSENFAQRIPMHPTCWIDTLKDHGVKLHDMKEVFKRAEEEAKKKKPQQKKHKDKRRRIK